MLFDEPRDLEREIDKLREDMDKLRKSLHAKIGETNRKISEIDHDQKVISINLCKGKLIV
jgi:hypothetical protein